MEFFPTLEEQYFKRPDRNSYNKGGLLVRSNYDGLTALAALHTKVRNSTLEIIHEGGMIWTAHFTFNDPAHPQDIATLKAAVLLLPHAYEQFLLHHNGAILYYDGQYGQWGFQLYGTSDLIDLNERQKKRFDDDWPASYLAFARSFGDADALVFDLSKPVEGGLDYVVLDGDSGELPHDWVAAAPSFGDWLDRLVVAQGAKYWRWY